MKANRGCLSVLIVIAAIPLHADDVVIQSFDRSGALTFGEVTDAISYSVEWSPSAEGGWTNFTGDVGTWLDNMPASGSGVVTASVPMFYRVLAHVPPPGMAYVPAGTFKMGNATNVFPEAEGGADELPQHEVFTDDYFIDKCEVTKGHWKDVKYAAGGYGFDIDAPQTPAENPRDYVNWYDAVKWCNARSEVEGLTPVYYTDAGFSNIYKTGHVEPYVNWATNGYRLPTEAEWEKAARGGVPDTRFPWSDYTNKISHAKANYEACCGLEYDLSSGYHPVYYTNSSPHTSPVGVFQSSGYGLYDMTGNILEWCWDWHDTAYYSASSATNPCGPPSGSLRVLRGGSFFEQTSVARCSARGHYPPTFEGADLYGDVGFRCVRRP